MNSLDKLVQIAENQIEVYKAGIKKFLPGFNTDNLGPFKSVEPDLTGYSIEEKLQMIEDNQTRVYDAGVRKYTSNKTTDKSDFIHITDSAAYKVLDFGMEGKTEQETVAGNQLFDISKFRSSETKVCINNGDGSITMNQYPFSADSKISECCPSIQAGQTIIISAVNPGRFIWFGGTLKQYNSSFEVTQAMLDNDVLGFYGKDDTTPDNPLTISDIMINVGNTALPYEPYVGGAPSPNPDYPQEIMNAGKLNEETGRYEIGCKFGNKNLFYKANENRATCDIQLQAGTAITCSAEVDYGGTVDIIYTDDTSYAYGMSLTTEERRHGAVYTLPKDVKQIRFRLIAVEPQVEIGSLTSYTPHASQPLTLTSPVPLTKWDYLTKRDGVWGWSIWSMLYENITESNVTGNGSSINDYFRIYVKHIQAYKGTECLCNMAIYNRMQSNNCCGFWYDSDFCMYLHRDFIGYTETDTIADILQKFKDNILSKGITVVCQMQEEQSFHPLPENEQTLLNNLETYYGVTNLYNDQGCPMWIKYIAVPNSI